VKLFALAWLSLFISSQVCHAQVSSDLRKREGSLTGSGRIIHGSTVGPSRPPTDSRSFTSFWRLGPGKRRLGRRQELFGSRAAPAKPQQLELDFLEKRLRTYRKDLMARRMRLRKNGRLTLDLGSPTPAPGWALGAQGTLGPASRSIPDEKFIIGGGSGSFAGRRGLGSADTESPAFGRVSRLRAGSTLLNPGTVGPVTHSVGLGTIDAPSGMVGVGETGAIIGSAGLGSIEPTRRPVNSAATKNTSRIPHLLISVPDRLKTSPAGKNQSSTSGGVSGGSQ